MKTLKIRFHVYISGWVTVERQVADEFDVSKIDGLSSIENDVADAMADEAMCLAPDLLDGEVDDQQVLS